MRQLRKHSKYLITPILIALLAVPMLLSGCGGDSSAADTPSQTPFDQLKGKVSAVESKVSQLEADLEDVDLDTLGTIVSSFNSLKAQFDDLVLAFGVLQDSLDALTIRVDDLEQDDEEPDEGESALALTILEEPQTIVNSGKLQEFTIRIENLGETPTMGQVVLELQAETGAAWIDEVIVKGEPFGTGTIINRNPSPKSCSEIIVISESVTLTGGQKIPYLFNVTIEHDPPLFEWNATLEIAD